LRTAIEKVSAVYSKDTQNNLPREVVARHAGYNGITGASLSMLSSLLKYGLLTGRGDNTSVSDLALQIIAHPAGSEERRTAILEAAFTPDLFAEIRDHYKSGKVSDQALRSYLLTRKFLPNAVDDVIRAYRETMELVETEGAGHNATVVETVERPMPSQPQLSQPSELTQGGKREPATPPPSAPMQRIGSSNDGMPYEFWHSPGRLRGSFDITDEKSAERVRRAVNAWIDAWKILGETSESVHRPTDEIEDEGES
jgi:hypothetical protein